MKSFHDFNVFECNINCTLRAITLKLREHHGCAEGTVVFNGVVGHRFENVLEGNIISAFVELQASQFYQEFEKDILNYQKWGLPILSKTELEFLVESKRKKLKFISIESSYGLSGWIICTTITVT